MGIVLVIAIFAVLIVFVALGKLKPASAKAKEATIASNASGHKKSSGKIDKTYLIAANEQSHVTFEVHFASGGITAETTAINSSRYKTLKEYEPERIDLIGSWGNDITITYSDGHSVKCVCSWLNWEAADMRNSMLTH